MKSKKAILVPAVLKMVIAVAAIFLLLYLAVSLYGIFNQKTAINQAREHMDKIEKIIKDLEEQGGGSKEYVLLSPRDWALIAFPNFNKNPDPQYPDPGARDFRVYSETCLNKDWIDCLCFCHVPKNKNNADLKVYISTLFVESCDVSGICIEVNQEEVIVAPSQLDRRNLWMSINDLESSLIIKVENNKLDIHNKV